MNTGTFTVSDILVAFATFGVNQHVSTYDLHAYGAPSECYDDVYEGQERELIAMCTRFGISYDRGQEILYDGGGIIPPHSYHRLCDVLHDRMCPFCRPTRHCLPTKGA